MKTIFVIAGHHLKDSGAVAHGYQENQMAIDLRSRIVKNIRLQNPNIKVWTDDDSHTLSQVITQVNSLATPDDILMDIHFNAANNETAQGSEAYIARNAREKSIAIAGRSNEVFAKMMRTPDRGIKYDYKSQHNRLGILYTPASSFLQEVEFITNASAMANYMDIRDRLAIAIANILIQETDA